MDIFDELIERVQAVEDSVEAVVDAWHEIKWKSIDKDNMEFRATITCYQKDLLDQLLARKPLK